MFEIIAFAETAATTAPQPTGPASLIGSFLPMILVIVLLYFMMIRPQKKKEKQTKAMLDAMKVGDKIVTVGGIVGKITKIKDEFVYIESGSVGTPNEKSYLKMERNAIRQVEQKIEA